MDLIQSDNGLFICAMLIIMMVAGGLIIFNFDKLPGHFKCLKGPDAMRVEAEIISKYHVRNRRGGNNNMLAAEYRDPMGNSVRRDVMVLNDDLWSRLHEGDSVSMVYPRNKPENGELAEELEQNVIRATQLFLVRALIILPQILLISFWAFFVSK